MIGSPPLGGARPVPGLLTDGVENMAKKDTYLALLRRGIDENTAQILSDGVITVGDLK